MTYYVADSAVFIMGYPVESTLLITVPSVVNELKSSEAANRFEIAREEGARVEAPQSGMTEDVLNMAKHTRDLEELSTTDIEILAKALERKSDATLLTDDYAVQNVAVMLGIDVKPVVQKKIRDILVWEKQCVGCRKRFDEGDICPICGSDLKKRRKRKV
ncbi:MAG TPA: NOB1 family endonuclease [Methanosarcinaceae archaeon]|nr:NOB1 family endonuclease [Methanosarcinaceae archaeon]